MGFKKNNEKKETAILGVSMDVIKKSRNKLEKKDNLTFIANDFYIGNYNNETYVMLINENDYIFLPSIDVNAFVEVKDDIIDSMTNLVPLEVHFVERISKTTGRKYFVTSF